MGAGASKTQNVADMVARDITDIHSETIQSTFAKTTSSQDMKIKIGACTIKGTNFMQGATFQLDVEAMQAAATDTKLDVSTKNKLKQAAEATRQNITTRMGDDYTQNLSSALTEAYTDIYTQTRQDCFLDLTNTQTMDIEISGAGCDVADLNFTQDVLHNAVLSCTQKAVTDNAVVKKLMNDMDQTATSKEEDVVKGMISAFMQGLTGPVAILAGIAGLVALVAVVMYGGKIFGGGGDGPSPPPVPYQFLTRPAS